MSEPGALPMAMRLAIIIDEERLNQEQPMLHRLCIGLMAEGVQVTRIVPDSIDADRIDQRERRIALAGRVQTPLKVLPWMRSERLANLLDAMERAMPDVLYAVGHSAWPVGRDLAEALDRPLLLDISSTAQAALVPPRRMIVAGYVVASSGLASALGRSVDQSLIHVVPMGVSLPAEPKRVVGDRDTACLAVLGACRDLVAYRALLTGLSRVTRQYRGIQLIMELQKPLEHDIWREAERLDLVANISAISSASAYRALLASSDAVLLPEVGGEVRSIVLECMAAGVPVLARADEALDMLIDQRTAVIINAPDTDQWVSNVLRLLEEPQWATSIGLQGRLAVERDHRSARQVSGLLNVLEKVAGGSLRFADS